MKHFIIVFLDCKQGSDANGEVDLKIFWHIFACYVRSFYTIKRTTVMHKMLDVFSIHQYAVMHHYSGVIEHKCISLRWKVLWSITEKPASDKI